MQVPMSPSSGIQTLITLPKDEMGISLVLSVKVQLFSSEEA